MARLLLIVKILPTGVEINLDELVESIKTIKGVKEIINYVIVK